MPHMVGNVFTEISCTQKGLLKAAIHCEIFVANCRKATVAAFRAQAYWESCCKVRSGIRSAGGIGFCESFAALSLSKVLHRIVLYFFLSMSSVIVICILILF